MIPDKLYRLALLVMFTLAVIQIINFFRYKPMMDSDLEHMNPSLLTHQVEDWAPEWTDKPTINYYYRDNRYSTDMKLKPKLMDPLHLNPGLSCAPQFDWDVKATPGANNVYGDLIWQKTNPKMVLESNCLHCSHNKRQPALNPPVGVASSFTTHYDNDMTVGSLDV